MFAFRSKKMGDQVKFKSKYMQDLQSDAARLSLRAVAVSTLQKYCMWLRRYAFFHTETIRLEGLDKRKPLLPASTTLIAMFLAKVYKENDGSYPQVKAARSGLKYAHTAGGYPNSPIDSQQVLLLIEGLKKSYHAPRKHARCPSLAEVNAWLTYDSDNFITIRTQAIMAIVCGCGMRGEEVLALTPVDIQHLVVGWKEKNEEVTGSAVRLKVAKTKTDVYRKGHSRLLTGKHLIHALEKYLQLAGLSKVHLLDSHTATSSLFRRTQHYKGNTRMIPVKISRVNGAEMVTNYQHISNSVLQQNFKDLQKATWPHNKPTTVHGGKAVLASALMKKGAGAVYIKKLGGWASDVFQRYLHSEDADDIKMLSSVHDQIFGPK